MTSPSKVPEVTFLVVRTAHEKLQRIASLVQEHFHKGQRVLLHIPNQAAADYLSGALWRFPPEGFIPHRIVQEESDFPLVITSHSGNLNRADVLFHLCPAPCKQVPLFSLVYDLFDETAGSKLLLARQRQADYDRRGYRVVGV